MFKLKKTMAAVSERRFPSRYPPSNRRHSLGELSSSFSGTVQESFRNLFGIFGGNKNLNCEHFEMKTSQQVAT